MLRVLKWVHQTAGLIGALLILMISITGILLNHRSLIGYSSDRAMKLQEFLFALHSGTVSHISIVWLTDFGAVCMIILSVTGVWQWISMFRVKTRKGRKKS